MWNIDILGVPFIHLMFVLSKNFLVDLMNVDKLGFWELYLCICVFVYLFSMEVFIRSFCNCSCLRLYDNSSASFLLASPWEKTPSSFSRKLLVLIFYRFSFFLLLQDLQAPLQGVVQNVQLLGKAKDWLEYYQFQTNYNKSMFWCTFNLSIVNFKQKDYKKLISSWRVPIF